MHSRKSPKKVDWKPIIQLAKIMVTAIVGVIRMKAHFISPVNISPIPGPSDEAGKVV